MSEHEIDMEFIAGGTRCACGHFGNHRERMAHLEAFGLDPHEGWEPFDCECVMPQPGGTT